MRLSSLIPALALSVTLGACASTPDKPGSAVKSGDVQSQALGAGECGLFGWTTDEKRDFVFYADRKEARYADADGPIDLVAETEFPSLTYTDPEGRPVELRLGQGEAMAGGRRFPGARVVTQTEEGWERLRPVAIVQSCQPK